MNIAEILLRRAAELGDNAAIVDVHRNHDRSYSFRELDVATCTVAEQLRGAGLKPGDGVLLLHPVAAELYLVLIALFRLGCVAIFLDPYAGRAHIERCCAIFPPKAFFGSPRAQLLRWTIPALRRVPQAFCSGWFPGSLRLDLRTDAAPQREIVSLAPEAPALVTFTSGSTGQPKAALRTHGFLLAQHRALETSLALKAGTRDLTTLRDTKLKQPQRHRPSYLDSWTNVNEAALQCHLYLASTWVVHPFFLDFSAKQNRFVNKPISRLFMARQRLNRWPRLRSRISRKRTSLAWNWAKDFSRASQFLRSHCASFASSGVFRFRG